MSIFIIKKAVMMKDSHQPPGPLYAILGTYYNLRESLGPLRTGAAAVRLYLARATGYFLYGFMLSRHQAILVTGFCYRVGFFFSGVFRVDTCGITQLSVAQILQHVRMIWVVSRLTLHPINSIKISGSLRYQMIKSYWSSDPTFPMKSSTKIIGMITKSTTNDNNLEWTS